MQNYNGVIFFWWIGHESWYHITLQWINVERKLMVGIQATAGPKSVVQQRCHLPALDINLIKKDTQLFSAAASDIYKFQQNRISSKNTNFQIFI